VVQFGCQFHQQRGAADFSRQPSLGVLAAGWRVREHKKLGPSTIKDGWRGPECGP
jgi:hypothetical protein